MMETEEGPKMCGAIPNRFIFLLFPIPSKSECTSEKLDLKYDDNKNLFVNFAHEIYQLFIAFLCICLLIKLVHVKVALSVYSLQK